ncbi:helix-turn-helix domain-containing protein [Pedobacter sp. R20-19]|uniref:helix-turn-helix domain-containing protein n=1 Tax=Pedobacter sp. R20-19 TaxID=1270196 RepID=UPI00068CADF1|nr:helix-turn-helix transcriptional regulator [Pedobacter sp. R20-19]
MDEIRKDQLLKSFGAHLKELRNRKDISLRILEQLCDVEHSQIHKIEKGLSSPTLITMVALAEGLKIPLKELIDFKYENKTPEL